MDINLYITFILVSTVLIVIPGPNVLLIISMSMSHGIKSGLLTVLGTSSAMVLQLFIVALGTAWFVESLTTGFVYLRWLGVGYLLYLGMTHLLLLVSNSKEQFADISVPATFVRGFFISLTNPKTMLFFAAFLPQFIIVEASYPQQFMLLSMTFLILATLLDSLYAILAGKACVYFKSRDLYKIQHGVSGVFFIGASTWLALTKRG